MPEAKVRVGAQLERAAVAQPGIAASPNPAAGRATPQPQLPAIPTDIGGMGWDEIGLYRASFDLTRPWAERERARRLLAAGPEPPPPLDERLDDLSGPMAANAGLGLGPPQGRWLALAGMLAVVVAFVLYRRAARRGTFKFPG